METKELFKTAHMDCRDAIKLADTVINGDIELQIGEMLEVFAIIKYWKDCYDSQAEACGDKAIVAGCQKWSETFQSRIEEFHEIFFEFEWAIIDYVKGLRKMNMTKEQIAVVQVFIDNAKQNKYLAWEWAKFQLPN